MAGFVTKQVPVALVDNDGLNENYVWDDVNSAGAVLTQAAAGNPGKDEFKDSTGTDTGVTTYAIGLDERLSGSLEIPHDYKEGSILSPHFHFQIIDAPTGTDKVKFMLTYNIGRGGVALAATTPIYCEIDVTTQYAFYTGEFPDISGTGLVIGNQFIFSLERVDASADEFAGDCLLATVGIHYQMDTIGSKQKTVKR